MMKWIFLITVLMAQSTSFADENPVSEAILAATGVSNRACSIIPLAKEESQRVYEIKDTLEIKDWIKVPEGLLGFAIQVLELGQFDPKTHGWQDYLTQFKLDDLLKNPESYQKEINARILVHRILSSTEDVSKKPGLMWFYLSSTNQKKVQTFVNVYNPLLRKQAELFYRRMLVELIKWAILFYDNPDVKVIDLDPWKGKTTIEKKLLSYQSSGGSYDSSANNLKQYQFKVTPAVNEALNHIKSESRMTKSGVLVALFDYVISKIRTSDTSIIDSSKLSDQIVRRKKLLTQLVNFSELPKTFHSDLAFAAKQLNIQTKLSKKLLVELLIRALQELAQGQDYPLLDEILKPLACDT